jgi:hypothetical protein
VSLLDEEFDEKRDMTMRAMIGDRLVVRGVHGSESTKEAVILAVEGEDGAPPYRVRWDDGREGVFVPGSGVEVEHLPVPYTGEAETP